MKKALIGGLIGGLILFVWQFLSWSMLNIHGSQMSYSPQQDQVLQALADINLDEGEYFMPTVKPDATQEEFQALTQEMTGKPWATIKYHHAYNVNMGMNMFRGFVINFLAAFLMCYLLLGDNNLSFMKVLTGCLMVGLISYLTIPYLNSIWFETNSIPDLIDALVQWGLAGAALGWYLTRK